MENNGLQPLVTKSLDQRGAAEFCKQDEAEAVQAKATLFLVTGSLYFILFP